MQFEIVDEEGCLASIDVLEVWNESLELVIGRLNDLLKIARADADFIAAALHRSLASSDQPLAWAGAVSSRTSFVALYARWRDGHRLGFTGTPEGRDLLGGLAPLTPEARQMLDQPEASLYLPILLDATGELCPNAEDCEAGHGIGPIIDDTNPRAQFINVFDTTPDRQQRLLDAVGQIMPVARAHDGYLRTAIHRSIDGTKVANYGQYQNFDQVRSMYFHLKTAQAFGSLLFKDVTKPAEVFGWPASWPGASIGTIPKLRCYTVEHVVASAADHRASGATR